MIAFTGHGLRCLVHGLTNVCDAISGVRSMKIYEVVGYTREFQDKRVAVILAHSTEEAARIAGFDNVQIADEWSLDEINRATTPIIFAMNEAACTIELFPH